MIKKYLSLMVICSLAFGVNTGFVTAQTVTTNNLSQVEKVKANILKRGTGSKEKVKVKMLNGTEMEGFISQAGENSFTLTNSKTNQTVTLAYSDVSKVKGNGLSTGAKIAIGVGIGVAVTAAVLAAAIASAADGFLRF